MSDSRIARLSDYRIVVRGQRRVRALDTSHPHASPLLPVDLANTSTYHPPETYRLPFLLPSSRLSSPRVEIRCYHERISGTPLVLMMRSKDMGWDLPRKSWDNRHKGSTGRSSRGSRNRPRKIIRCSSHETIYEDKTSRSTNLYPISYRFTSLIEHLPEIRPH